MKNSMELRSICQMAWQFIKINGMSKAEAFKQAWKNFKLKMAMKKRIVKFYFQKIDGSIREAYGHLIDSMLPPAKGTGTYKPNPTTQCYWDTERGGFRCFKIANLISFV